MAEVEARIRHVLAARPVRGHTPLASGCLVTLLSVAALGGLSMIVAALLLTNRVGQVIPPYPNTQHGEHRDMPNDTLTIWLFGDQFINYDTTDSPDAVRAWYHATLSGRGWYGRLATTQPPCYVLGIFTNPNPDGTTRVVLELARRDATADTYSPPCR